MRCLVVVLALTTGCSAVSAGAGLTRHDPIARSRFSEGTTGNGFAVEAGSARRTRRGEIGAYATLDFMELDYRGQRWVGASVRYRRYLLGSGRTSAYVAFGGGVGGFVSGVRLEAHAELGARLEMDTRTALTLGLRERPAINVTECDVSAYNVVNTLELALGLEITIGARSRAESAAPPVGRSDPRIAVSRSCGGRWGWFLEATAWAGVGLAEDTEGLLRNAGGAIYRPCDDLSVRAGLALSLWATGEDQDQQHGVFGLYRVGPEFEVDFIRSGRSRLGVAAGIDVAFGRAHDGGADLAIHGGVRFRYRGLVVGADIAHGFDPPSPSDFKRDTTIVLGIGQSGHAPFIGVALELLAFAIVVNSIHRN
jgi:hypothetical protein